MTMIGIDLGTSNSLVCYWQDQQVVEIPNEFGRVLTPSVVGLDDDGELIVGEIAKERLGSHPGQTVAAFKRLMGTKKIYQLGQQQYTATELSAAVLKSLKKSAEVFLETPCQEAVISVPAYFNNIQREATIEAATLAGLKVRQLISEPTAAAVAYGLHKEIDQMILVLDLGGGTFDVSLLEIFEGVLQVEAIAGDNQLGGEDFTHVLLNDFIDQNQAQLKGPAFHSQRMIQQQLDTIKCSLSKQAQIQTQIVVGEEAYSYEITQQLYEEKCQKLLERLKEPIVRVLNDGRIRLEDIDQVILVGGATKSLMIRNYFAKLLKKIPYTLLEPDKTVAHGTAIQASMKTGQILREELVLTDVCGYSMGVDIAKMIDGKYQDGYYSPIIERNTTIPVSREKSYFSMQDNQKLLTFGIYQGESAFVRENLKIGELSIKLPPYSSQGYEVNCRFTYDRNGILEVIVTDKQTQKQVKTIIEEQPGKLTAAEINDSLKKLAALKIHPRDRAENQLLLAQLNRLYRESLGEQRERIQEMILQYQEILAQQNEAMIKRAYRDYTKWLQALERTLDY